MTVSSKSKGKWLRLGEIIINIIDTELFSNFDFEKESLLV